MRIFFDTILSADSGRPLVGAQVRVLEQAGVGEPAGDPATIYRDAAGATAAPNPITVLDSSTSAPGLVLFYAQNGIYTLQYLYQGDEIKTIPDVDISADVSTGQLSDVTGASLIGTSEGITVQDALNQRLPVLLFDDLGDVTLPDTVDFIHTSGRSVPGKGAARYARDSEQTALSSTGTALLAAAVASGQISGDALADLTALEAHFRRPDASGTWFTLAEPEPTSAMFGCVIDGVYDYRTGTVTGTDDIVPLQALIDYCMEYANAPARLSPGCHKIGNTLHLGYGHRFAGLTLSGPGAMYLGENGFNGACIAPTFTDRQAVNIQGARGHRISGFTVGGKLAAKIIAQKMAYLEAPLVDDTDPLEWDDETFDIEDRRHSPYAAFCIDGFSGTDPVATGPGYPATRPAWVPYGQYVYGDPGVAGSRKLDSSDFAFSDLGITGFTAAWMCNPSNSAVQGDFFKIDQCRATRVKYVVSLGNNQSRNVDINNCNFAYYYCAFTNSQHGTRTGNFGGTVSNTSLGAGIDLFDIDLAYGPPFTLDHCYCEVQWRIGRVRLSGANDGPIKLQDCEMSFHMESDALQDSLFFPGQPQAARTRGLPGAMLYNPVTPGGFSVKGAVRIEGGIYKMPRVMSLMAVCEIDGAVSLPVARVNPITEEYERHFHNALAGGFVLPGLDGHNFQHRMSYTVCNLDTGNLGSTSAITEDGFGVSSRLYGTPVYVRTMRAGDDDYFDLIPRGRKRRLIGKTALTYSGTGLGWDADDGSILRFFYNAATLALHGTVYGLGPGGVMLDHTTGSVLAIMSSVEAGGGLTVTARLQNNYRWNADTEAIERIEEINLGAGEWRVAHCRYFTLPLAHYGDYASGASVIDNVLIGSGAAQLTGQIEIGDRIESGHASRPLLAENEGAITAFDADSITYTGTAGYDSLNERLERLIRFLPPDTVI